jgi:hypothetical protein
MTVTAAEVIRIRKWQTEMRRLDIVRLRGRFILFSKCTLSVECDGPGPSLTYRGGGGCLAERRSGETSRTNGRSKDIADLFVCGSAFSVTVTHPLESVVDDHWSCVPVHRDGSSVWQ